MALPGDKKKGKGQEMEESLTYVILSMSRVWVNMTYYIIECEYANKILIALNQTNILKQKLPENCFMNVKTIVVSKRS